MTPFELRESLGSIVLLVDSREQPTKRLEARIKATGYPYERVKLSFGDYSAKCTLPDGETLDLSHRFAVERKLGIDELCGNFGRQRARFEREFERAKAAGARVYLLVEDSNWEKIFNHGYKSLLSVPALVASLLAWQIRYDMRIIMCRNETTGRMIREIVYREAKEALENMR